MAKEVGLRRASDAGHLLLVRGRAEAGRVSALANGRQVARLRLRAYKVAEGLLHLLAAAGQRRRWRLTEMGRRMEARQVVVLVLAEGELVAVAEVGLWASAQIERFQAQIERLVELVRVHLGIRTTQTSASNRRA